LIFIEFLKFYVAEISQQTTDNTFNKIYVYDLILLLKGSDWFFFRNRSFN